MSPSANPSNFEYFLVLDVSDHGSSIGGGAYKFKGDPCEEHSCIENQQKCEIREKYPGNLIHTHAGLLYRQGFHVSRMGIPVFNMHGKWSNSSENDIEALYQKTRTFVLNVVNRPEILVEMREKVDSVRNSKLTPEMIWNSQTSRAYEPATNEEYISAETADDFTKILDTLLDEDESD